MSKTAQRNAFGEALVEAGEKYNNVVVVDADLSGATKINGFAKRFPDRFFNVGISEADGISAAAGMAKAGLRPFFASFAVFTSSRYDPIRTSVAYSKAPVVLVGTHSGLIGKDGASHQALEDVAILSSLPGLKIYQPADPLETKQIVHHLAGNDEMAYLRVSRHPQEDVHAPDYKFAPGKADILIDRPSLDAIIFSTGYLTTHAMDASKRLWDSKGVSAHVINFSTLKPIDTEMITRYAKTGKPIITVEDHNPTGGLGSRVCEVIAKNGLPSRVLPLGVDGFGESGAPEELYKKFKLDSESISQQVVGHIENSTRRRIS